PRWSSRCSSGLPSRPWLGFLVSLRRLGELALPLEGLDPGDLAAGLADLARRLQPVGRRLEAQVEQVFLGVAQRGGELVVGQGAEFGGFHQSGPCSGHWFGRRWTKRHLNGIL